MCLIGLFYPIAAVAYNVLKVRSNGAVILRLEIIKKVIMTIILATTIPISVMAVAWGMVAAAVCEMLLNIGASMRFTSLGIYRFTKTLLPIALLTAVMYGATVIIGEYSAELSVGLRLTIKIFTGVITYIAGAFLTRMESFGEALTIAKQFLSKQK